MKDLFSKKNRSLAALLLLILMAMPLWATSVNSQGPEEEAPAEEETIVAPSAPSATIFSYQGQLLDGNGKPISNAAMPMTFKLYTTATGGTACWTENHTAGNAINVSDGLFHVLLGQITAINSACLTNEAYLELVIDSETLSPRELLTSVAHAVEASSLADGDLAVVGDISSTGEIYEEYKSVTYSDNDARWFRFAESPASGVRNSGVFEIRWGRASQHGHVRFAVGADYGEDAGIGITILDTSTYGPLSGLGKIRLLMNDSYEQMYLEAYNEGGGTGATITFDVYKYSGWGWNLIDITDGSVPTDYESYQMPTDIVFGARSDENDIFVLNRDGNVGIGTASPSEKLDVAGDIRIRKTGTTSKLLFDAQTNDPGGIVHIENNNAAKLWLYPSDDWDTNPTNDYIVFGDANQVSEKFWFRGDGTSYLSGNVGIGTTSPSKKLDVNGEARIRSDLTVEGWNISMGDDIVLRHDGSRTFHIVPWGGSGRTYDDVCIGCGSPASLIVRGNLDVSGSCSVAAVTGETTVASADETCEAGSITSGAYIEANLQTSEERRAERIESFTRGDLLCWQAESQKLELCSTANDRLVMAVADPKGKPIVIGAEPIKVVGPVKAGDILVASDVPGYAIVNNNPLPGTVIAQALEDFDGEKGLIKAMIRKW